jgi:RNA polymerase sigma factor (sigma-70 family)
MSVSPCDLHPPGVPAFDRLVEDHGRAVLRFCIVQAGPQRAEDVFQEKMLTALRAYDTVRDRAAVKAWLFSIAARKAIDAHRLAARSPEPVADLEDLLGASAPDPLPGQETWAQVALLPEKQRQAVALRFLADLSHAEIADVMQTGQAAARRNVFEGLKRLRRDLDSAPTTEKEQPR